MSTFRPITLIAGALAAGLAVAGISSQLTAQDRLPWQSGPPAGAARDDGYRQPPPAYDDRQNDGYRQNDGSRQEDAPRADRTPPAAGGYRPADPYRRDEAYRPNDRARQDDAYRPTDRARADDSNRPLGGGAQGGYIDNYRSGRGYVADQPPRDDAGPGYDSKQKV